MKKSAVNILKTAFVLLFAVLLFNNQPPAVTPSESEPNNGTAAGQKNQTASSEPLAKKGDPEIKARSGANNVSNSSVISAPTTPIAERRGDVVIGPNGQTYPLRRYKTMTLPNDPTANQAWVTTANMAAAWDSPAGNSQTLLAVIDTGFALEHEEFTGRWYSNSAESVNGLDDDGNGLIDDISGWDFANNDNSLQAIAQGQHGTYVAGMAAATGNNGLGIAGVDWATKLLPIQVLGENGEGYNSDVANGIQYAADHGADVINLSLGSELPDALVREAVQYAIAKGAVVVAAAGNTACNCMVYPANYPEVLAVGASSSNGQPASFSSYGSNLDILAPGVNLTTTNWQTGNNSAYASGINGTSLAAPIVSGLLTRLKSQLPEASPLQLVAAVTETTNRLSLAPTLARSDSLGFGLLSGGLASQRVITPSSPAQRTVFADTSFGSYLSPLTPTEVAGTAKVYQCENSRPGSTAIYELTKSGSLFFSASLSEVYRATQQGYVSSLFSFACLSQPHDQPDFIRSLNIYSEFRNL